MTTQPFAGLKVLDFAWAVAGPQIGRMLADYGATVVRVESSSRVDSSRQQGPFPGGRLDLQQSMLFETCNANKLGLLLNMAKDEGRAVALDLANWADVIIESFRPGQMARFGLDYASLRDSNPGLLMVSTSLLGQVGPKAQFAGYGNMGAALSGYQQLVGLPGELPIGPYGPYTDFMAPRFALMALLAALDHRRRTGEGRHLDISQAEAAIALLAPQIAASDATGDEAEAQGNRDPYCAPSGVFPARGDQRWIAIVARTDDDWRRLATLIGGVELANNPRFLTLDGRQRHEDELEQIIADWTSQRDASELEQILQANGISAHLVAAPADVFADPQLAARGQFVRLPHPLLGETIFDASRCQLSETPALYQRTAPTFGRDNSTVLSDILGYSAERIDALQSGGILS